MSAGFYYDDDANLLEVPALQWNDPDLEQLARSLDDVLLPSRPVSNLSLAINHLVSGLDPEPYHWTNLLMHLATGLALFWVLRLFQYYHGESSVRSDVALLAMFLFLVHPLNVQAVTYVVQRMTLLATLFMLLSLGCYLKARFNEVPKPRMKWVALSVVCFAASSLSKEIGLLLLPLLLLYEYCFHREAWRRRIAGVSAGRRVIAVATTIALVAMVVSALASLHVGTTIYWFDQMPYRDFSGFERVLTQSRVQFFYLSLLALPLPSRLNLEHDFEVSRSLLEPATTLLAVAGILFILIIAIRLIPTRPRLAFPVLAYFLLHSMESAPVNLELVFEHRMYLPMTMLALMLTLNGEFLRLRLWQPAYVVLTLVGLFLATATFERNRVWSDALTLYEDSAMKSPNKFRPQYNFGSLLGQHGRLREAQEVLENALSIEPDSSPAHNQLGNIYLMTRHIDVAESHYRRAVELEPQNAEALYNLASVLGAQQRFDEQMEVLEAFVLHAQPYLAEQKRWAEQQLQRRKQ